MEDGKLIVPKIVLEKYDELYDLVENQSTDGILLPKQVARYLGKDTEWLLNTIYEGSCPFAFGNNRGVKRGSSCIHVLPFYAYMVQGQLFNAVMDRRDK